MSMRMFEIMKPKWSQATIGNDVLVWIDTEKVRASWEKDKDSYFDAPEGKNAIKGRIPRFDEWMKRGEAVRAPEVCLTQDGEISFTNGRHRFVWMLQHGIKTMPVAVPPEYADAVQDRFGSGKRDLTEMPMTSLNLHGDTTQAGTFRPDDVKKITSPEWQDRVIKLFSKVEIDIELHLLHGTHTKEKYDRETGKFTPTDEKGHRYAVNKHALDAFYPKTDFRKYSGLQSLEWGERILGTKLNGQGVTLILTFNEGADRVGLTPWMLGHRIAHAFFENTGREANEKFASIYAKVTNNLASLVSVVEKVIKANGEEIGYDNEERIAKVASLISSFRSAKTMNVRDSGEYAMELMTQYLIAGKVVFNTSWINDETSKAGLDSLAKLLSGQFEQCLRLATGKVVVL